MNMPQKLLAPVMLALSLGLASCHAPDPVQEGVAVQARAIAGTIQTPSREVAALITDVANGATVALIDGTTGTTVATTVSNPQGGFSLYLPSGFTPVAGRPYYLEAVKGLAAGGTANRAGAPIARLRTILFPQGANWVSLNSSVPGDSISIGWASTAVALIASLRGLAVADQLNLVGKVISAGTSFNPTGTLITSTEFNVVYGLVNLALNSDQDPLGTVSYDPSGASPAAQYGRKPGNLVLYDTFSPALPATGSTVTLNGQDLPAPRSDVTVMIGEKPVASWTTNADRTQMTVTLPGNVSGGAFSITQGMSTWLGPFVPIAKTVGTFAGSGKGGFADWRGPQAMFSQPIDLVFDPQGNLYVADAANGRIRKISPAGTVTTLAGNGATTSLDGTGTGASFYSPHGIAIDSGGNLYVSDYGSHKIRKVTPAGVVTTLAGTGVAGFTNGPGASATLTYPTGVAVDTAGNVYVADAGNHAIRKIDPAGNVTTYAGTGVSGLTNGPRASATFYVPNGVATDLAGNVYVSDEMNYVIRKIDTSGNVTTLSNTTIGQPFGLKVDGSGNVYVAARAANQVVRVAPNGVVSIVSGSTLGYLDGPTAGALFNQPHSVALDAAGNLYVTDRYNNRIRVVSP